MGQVRMKAGYCTPHFLHFTISAFFCSGAGCGAACGAGWDGACGATGAGAGGACCGCGWA